MFPKIVFFSPPNHPLKNRVFHEIHHPFWGFSLIFGNTHIFHWVSRFLLGNITTILGVFDVRYLKSTKTDSPYILDYMDLLLKNLLIWHL